MLKRKILFLFFILQINNFVLSCDEKRINEQEFKGRSEFWSYKIKEYGLIAGFSASGFAASLIPYLLKCSQIDSSNRVLCLNLNIIAILTGGLLGGFGPATIWALCKWRNEKRKSRLT